MWPSTLPLHSCIRPTRETLTRSGSPYGWFQYTAEFAVVSEGGWQAGRVLHFGRQLAPQENPLRKGRVNEEAVNLRNVK
jgi:hypothetical protein